MGALPVPHEAMDVALGLMVPAIGQRLPRHGARRRGRWMPPVGSSAPTR